MRHILKASLSTLSLAAILASSLMSQGTLFPTKRLVGWSDLPTPSTTSYLELQEIKGCKKAQVFCKYPKFQPLAAQALKPYAGGTAYDARYRSVWISDGLRLAEQVIRGCKSRCPGTKATLANPNAYVSGLAIAQKKPRLFQLATTEYYWEVVTYDLKKCPKAISKCQYKFPTTGSLVRPVAGGLAYDEIHDLLYISISYRVATGGYEHMAFVSKASSPCKPICKMKIMPSSNKLVTGLAWDNCVHALYATDGQITQPHYFSKKNHCTPKIGPACKKQTTPTWRGLALIPGQVPVHKGKSCTKKPCQSCPSMYASTYGGDPVFGNNNFGFSLNNAPSAGIGVFILSYGPLHPTGFPFACGRLYALNGPIIHVGFQNLGGTGICNGSGAINFPLPTGNGAYNALCGKPLSAQWVVWCQSGSLSGFGGVSNAFSFQVTN